MVDLQVATTYGAHATLNEAAVEEFQESLRGHLVSPGVEGYEEARKIWNGMIDRKPALIARCAGVSDVINSVNFARENDLLVAVRGGGHSAAGNGICEGGIVIDLSPMKGVRVDPVKRTAQAQGGVLWNEFDRETMAFNLATPGGTVNDTGVAGLTLGGGLGWLGGKYGLSCDNLLSVDIVTASGQFLTASETENADLFWGVRGGSGNFGVVTSFEFRLHPVGQMLAGLIIYPRSDAKEVLRFYRDFSSNAPDELTAVAALLTSPEGQPVAVIGICYCGAVEQGEKVIKPLREFGSPAADLVGPKSYLEVQNMLDPAAFPHGIQRYWKSGFMDEISDAIVDLSVERAESMNSPLSMVLFFPIHGAIARVGAEETAYGLRGEKWDFDIISQWTDPTESDQQVQWTRDFWNAVEPYTEGVYVNHMSTDDAYRIPAAYGSRYDRLVALKNKYDPTNLFRINHNIKPTV